MSKVAEKAIPKKNPSACVKKQVCRSTLKSAFQNCMRQTKRRRFWDRDLHTVYQKESNKAHNNVMSSCQAMPI